MGEDAILIGWIFSTSTVTANINGKIQEEEDDKEEDMKVRNRKSFDFTPFSLHSTFLTWRWRHKNGPKFILS